MGKISKFQLYCAMVILSTPIAFLETPKRLSNLVDNNAWLAAFATIIPGILIVLLYIKLIEKSRQPFPLMLEEHLGKIAGKALGFIYIWFFILFSSYAIRLFVDFVKTFVHPATPISVLITMILIAVLAMIKSGLVNTSRVSEIITFIGLSFTFIIIIIAIFSNSNWENIRPIGYMSLKYFGQATLTASSVISRMIPVLTIAYFMERKDDITLPLYLALITSVLVIGLTSLATVLALGTPAANLFSYPTFEVVRLIKIGDFLHHLDILFVGIWILGTFATLSFTWFMACFTAQHVFGLKKYRFLAAPTSLIIGVLTVLISDNSLELNILSIAVIPLLYFISFIIIPVIVWLFTLFKPAVESSTSEAASG